MRAPRSLFMALAMVASTTLTLETASGAPLERRHYSGTDSFSFNDCGFQIDGVVTFSGLFMLKAGRQGDPTPYYFDNYEYRTVYTNPATGTWLTVSGNGLYKDLHIVNVTGTVYHFEAIEVGRPFQVRDMAGILIVKDRGRLQYGFSVDTLGDSSLDNDIFIEGSFQLLADNGRHPGFFLDFCALARDLIG
jgi:hypothetical protein